jgi:predicted O-linked N-acetylglucosamine transferase (SPINDLY family)
MNQSIGLSNQVMRCAGVAMVRNEADVIELWARYNLRVLESLHVIDHGSLDNTVQILEALQVEGLPIVLHHWSDVGHTQAEAMLSVARPLALSGEADFVVPLDADELLATDRAGLHQALRAVPDGFVGAMRWRTYLPAGDEAAPSFFRRRMAYRSLESKEQVKVIAPSHLLANHYWQTGNHSIYKDDSSNPLPHSVLPFVLAHYPVRGLVQLQRKVFAGALASRIKPHRFLQESWHWLKIEAELLRCQILQRPVDLKQIATDYSLAVSENERAQLQILEGAISDAPSLLCRYEARPLSLKDLQTSMTQMQQAHAEQLAMLGRKEFNAANQAWREHKVQDALQLYTEATLLNPTLDSAHLGRARCLVHLSHWMPAREAFAETLRLNPKNYSAWLEAGHLCRQMGELQQASGAYQHAINASPQRYEAHLAMARVLHQLDQKPLSAEAFERALKIAESAKLRAEVSHRMGQYLLELGDNTGAVQVLSLAIQSIKDQAGADQALDFNRMAEVQIDLGEALWRLGQHDTAMQVLTQASAADHEPTLVRLGAAAFRHNLWQEALLVLKKCVELHPQSATARWNLAHVLAESWQMDEAEQVLQEAEKLAPMPGAKSMRASIAGRQGDADTALRLYSELANEQGQEGKFASSSAMSSLYSDQLTAQEVADLHVSLFAPLGQGARSKESFKRTPLQGRRMKLGIVSADFHHQHPVNIFMQPVLREIDRTRFEVFLYFTGVSYDEQTRLAQQRIEHWVEATTLNDTQLAKRIDADGIDLLLDLAGHTGQQRMSLFAKRAAPVQATYLGYPGSTGVPNIDWVLGDAVVTPEGSDSLCSERIARLPGTVFCFAPEVHYPYPVFTDADAQRPLTFGSFNNVPKLTPRTLRLWAQILKAVPSSRLLLKAPSFSDGGAVRLFGERMQKLGVNLNRIEFRGPSGLTDMMAEYADVDIALDPVPYNGGTTSLQAMWMGVPVVTQRGHNFVSRMGASFMTAAGLPEWVAHDDAGYVQVAVQMAQDRTALLALKRGLRKQLQACRAWDVVAHTRAMEAVFERMVG